MRDVTMVEDPDTEAWLAKFGDIIIAYMKNRAADPFMEWFHRKNSEGFFSDDLERVLTILIDARFDQMTTAEKALENTKTAVEVSCLKKVVGEDELPLLIPRQYFTAEKWTESFVRALPNLHAIARRIVAQKSWKANELFDLLLNEVRTHYLGVKTTRLAVRWLHELVPDLEIDMSTYEIPIDRLVYRVSCRLGLIDPNIEKYSGRGSVADVKIQALVKRLLPEKQWFFDEPLWSSGRRAINGGHCYPRNPSCGGCLFESICPRRFIECDPAQLGMETRYTRTMYTPSTVLQKNLARTVTQKQTEFAEFVEELEKKGIRGEEWREKMKQWQREHSESG
jgi:hypothetical protein